MTIVFKVSDNVKEKIIDYYKDMRKEKTPPYAVFQAQEADTTITLYESGKIMFQGISADIDANIWIALEQRLNNRVINIDGTEKKIEKKETDHIDISTIGSDEVGTGDFFGPIVVTATFVSTKDFEFLNSLPGKKILLKGNHDYWWSTLAKMNKYLKENNFENIEFLCNNSFCIEDKIIVGTRGWTNTNLKSEENRKILKRENARLKLSIEDGIKKFGENKDIIAFLHYPPFYKEVVEENK